MQSYILFSANSYRAPLAPFTILLIIHMLLGQQQGLCLKYQLKDEVGAIPGRGPSALHNIVSITFVEVL